MQIDIIQKPEPGRSMVMFCGDIVTFSLAVSPELEGDAWIRTDLGRASVSRREIIELVDQDEIRLNGGWHDIRMRKIEGSDAANLTAADSEGLSGTVENEASSHLRYEISLPLFEVGRFQAKCFFMQKGSSTPLWPAGENLILNVDSAGSCCANIIYNAFVRQFGDTRWSQEPDSTGLGDSSGHSDIYMGMAGAASLLDRHGYTVIPPSGKFRDLIKEIDFIFNRLGCRILHLLPIHPTPTTYGRMGRYGSPYAALSFTQVDPALAEFDPSATPLEQFMELADAVHYHCGYLILDIAINHTGWASSIHERHPEWLVRKEDGTIEVPGAWGVRWEDLTRLDYSKKELWQYMADMFLLWCSRRVDGFRCDAGYMIPVAAWEYIIARVREEYPDTIFFLEGLGGGIHATCDLLNIAGMNWAYSELFQNYDRHQIESYLPGSIEISEKFGLMVNFAETHDNPRLALTSHTYAMMRTALCALFSVCGSFGFAAGVEWFATRKINVHESPSLNWGAQKNQIDLIARINRILKNHPAFSGGTEIGLVHAEEPEMFSGGRESVNRDRETSGSEGVRSIQAAAKTESGRWLVTGNCLALMRHHLKSGRSLIILVNLDCSSYQSVIWSRKFFDSKNVEFSSEFTDLITGRHVTPLLNEKSFALELSPGEVLALAPSGEFSQKKDESEEYDIDHCFIPESGINSDIQFPCAMPRRVLQQKFRARVLRIFSTLRGYGDIGALDEVIEKLENESSRKRVAAAQSEKSEVTDQFQSQSQFRSQSQSWTEKRKARDVESIVMRAADLLFQNPIEFCRACNPLGMESRVVTWRWGRDERRVVMVPPGFSLMVVAPSYFRADIRSAPAGRCTTVDGNRRSSTFPEMAERGFTAGYEEALPMENGEFFAIFMPVDTGKFPYDGESSHQDQEKVSSETGAGGSGEVAAKRPAKKPVKGPVKGAGNVATEFNSFSGSGSDESYSGHRYFTFRIRLFVDGKAEERRSELLYLADPDTLALSSEFTRKEIMADPSLKLLGFNRRGAMMRAAAWWGRLESRYDAILAANINRDYPENRWMLLSRYRIWSIYQGYSKELTLDTLERFTYSHAGEGKWLFDVPTSEGRHYQIEIQLLMVPHMNCTRMKLHRRGSKKGASFSDHQTENVSAISSAHPGSHSGSHSGLTHRKLLLPDEREVEIIIRPDIEDRSFHDTVKAWTGPENQWKSAVKPGMNGFIFDPSPESGRALEVRISDGRYIHEPEWSYMVFHPVEEERGLDPLSDLFSPGYFRATLAGGDTLVLRASTPPCSSGTILPSISPVHLAGKRVRCSDKPEDGAFSPLCNKLGDLINNQSDTRSDIRSDNQAGIRSDSPIDNLSRDIRCFTSGWTFKDALLKSLDAYIVERGENRSVIAGFPWFLDWGRDSLIFSRALIEAGRLSEAKDILRLFGKFEYDGTLPNMICGSDAGNRETSDAPLWFFAACREMYEIEGDAFLDEVVTPPTGPSGNNSRRFRDILFSIARSLIKGTGTGVKVDPSSSLIYSPSHFTWMDTNFPAASPRAGYPVEIQALWYYALTFLDIIGSKSIQENGICDEPHTESSNESEKEPQKKEPPKGDSSTISIWKRMALDVRKSAMALFYRDDKGYFSDCLHCGSFKSAYEAVPDDALRPNQLFLITLGLADDEEKCMKTVESCAELIVPGGIRSLSDRRVETPLYIRYRDATGNESVLGDPYNPYRGRYLGEEDRSRKPAYHNGTAWTWQFPVFCEAWAMVFGGADRIGKTKSSCSISSSTQDHPSAASLPASECPENGVSEFSGSMSDLISGSTSDSILGSKSDSISGSTYGIISGAVSEDSCIRGSAVRSARSWLGSSISLLRSGCAGQIPEILDGDAPHRPRGCDAQAWGSGELARVWLKLEKMIS